MASRETSAENKRILRALLALPENKTCADCKTATHPRWASWNLGIFLCIRCSGVHRSLGTHISKVRSVDLDSWLDSHLYEMQRWGNNRANLYWEAKLPRDYKPDESKIVNYIKTKYDLKRWVAGPLPSDPSSLDDGTYASQLSRTSPTPNSEHTPLAQVRSELRAGSNAPITLPPRIRQPLSAAPSVDLLGDFLDNPPSNKPRVSNRTALATTAVSHSTAHAQARPIPDLLGFDSIQKPNQTLSMPTPSKPVSKPPVVPLEAPPRAPPATVAPKGVEPTVSASPRTDLKQSILSLYASKTSPAAPTHTSAPVPSPGARPSSSLNSLSSVGPSTNDTAPRSGVADLLSDFDPWASSKTAATPAPILSTPAPSARPLQPPISTSNTWQSSLDSLSLNAPTHTAKPSTLPATSTAVPASTNITNSLTPALPVEEDDAFANVWT